MGAINEIDIAKLVLLPAILYVAKKIIDWAGKVMSSPPAKQKFASKRYLLKQK
ncbi:hypothetical protein N7608_27605 [Klebsiella grimontii]|nr:hypothetical protein [Klebsiella grimontii]MDG9851607.1 hypothetical protein [Klebsiella grimontii]MDG9965712.1 hypothetical protein [Klebsiella grimontii]